MNYVRFGLIHIRINKRICPFASCVQVSKACTGTVTVTVIRSEISMQLGLENMATVAERTVNLRSPKLVRIMCHMRRRSWHASIRIWRRRRRRNGMSTVSARCRRQQQRRITWTATSRESSRGHNQLGSVPPNPSIISRTTK